MIKKTMPIERLSPEDDHHYWVGYYDRQPWSSCKQYVLCHRASFCDRFPKNNESCEIGVLKDGEFVSVSTSSAWNWQQGAQLRWAIHQGEELLMFNDLDESGALISRWVALDGTEKHRVQSGIYTVSHDSMLGLSLSFGRLSRLRPEYGYPAVHDAQSNAPAPHDDGIWKIDLESGQRTMLISTNELYQFGKEDQDQNDQVEQLGKGVPHQHLNHIMINPAGTRCCFLHRFERDDGIQQSRLFTIGLDGSDPRLLMEGLVSHYDWFDDSTIIAWGGKRKLLGSGSSNKLSVMGIARRTLKPMYYALGKPRFLMNRVMGDSYLTIHDDEHSEPSVFAKGQLTCDGHNTFFRDRDQPRWMVTDGYPDMQSHQPLYLWDTDQSIGYEVGRFFTPTKLDGDVRVDLHPRFSRDGKSVCIDSAMDNTRAVYKIDIDQLITENQG